MALHAVEQPLGGEPQHGVALGPPVFGLVGIVLERAVAHQFGIETAVGGMVDVFVENAVEHGRNLRSRPGGVEFHRHLGRNAHGTGQESREKEWFDVHVDWVLVWLKNGLDCLAKIHFILCFHGNITKINRKLCIFAPFYEHKTFQPAHCACLQTLQPQGLQPLCRLGQRGAHQRAECRDPDPCQGRRHCHTPLDGARLGEFWRATHRRSPSHGLARTADCLAVGQDR